MSEKTCFRCEKTRDGRFDSPRCKNVTERTEGGYTICAGPHDFEPLAEMWERLYRDAKWELSAVNEMLHARGAEIVALREQINALSTLLAARSTDQ